MGGRRARTRGGACRALRRHARAPLKPGDLTVVVLARDEAARLPRTLARIPAGMRTFVLDAQSRDETVDIARARGAAVETRAWTGFVDARRYALGRVATPWAMMLDADELLDEHLASALLDATGEVDAYRVRRRTALCGVPVYTAGWSDERLVRVFRPDRVRLVARGVGGAAELHERWECDGRVADLPGSLLHDSYPSIASYREKFRRYTSIEAAALRPSRLALVRELAAFPIRFAWSILRYGGWRDGWRGPFVAWESARYRVVVRLKALRTR